MEGCGYVLPAVLALVLRNRLRLPWLISQGARRATEVVVCVCQGFQIQRVQVRAGCTQNNDKRFETKPMAQHAAGGLGCTLVRPLKLNSGLGEIDTAAQDATMAEIDALEWERCSEPAYDALNNVTKGAIVELKTFQKPPAGVQKTFEAVLIALGHANPTWRDCLTFLSCAAAGGLASYLRAYNPKIMTPATLRKMQPAMEEFPPERVQSISKAAGNVAIWVHAVYNVSRPDPARPSNTPTR